jgi:uncharacterized protein (DUF983 family)
MNTDEWTSIECPACGSEDIYFGFNDGKMQCMQCGLIFYDEDFEVKDSPISFLEDELE